MRSEKKRQYLQFRTLSQIRINLGKISTREDVAKIEVLKELEGRILSHQEIAEFVEDDSLHRAAQQA